MHDVLNVLVTLIFVAVLIALVVTSPKWVSAKIKRERARRAYYDSPYEPGDPAWRRRVPPWASEGIDEQPRPAHGLRNEI